MALGDLDTRWKNPQGNKAEDLYLWAQDLIKELRKGDYLSNAIGTGIANAQLANMADSTIKGRAVGAGTGSPQDLTATQATAILNALVGDSGSGGTKGLVPAPAAGDALKFLRGDATWARPGATLLTSGSVSGGSAQQDFVLTSYTAYRGLIFELINWIPATDDVDLYMRVSTNAGSSYDAGATDYRYGGISNFSNATNLTFGSAGTTQMMLAGSTSATSHIGNGSSEGINAQVMLMDQTNTAIKPKVWCDAVFYGAADFCARSSSSGHRNAAQDTDAVRFFFSSGNITSGTYAIYGLA